MSTTGQSGDTEQEKWNKVFTDLENDYKEAYYSIDKAIKLDEEGKLSEALPLYEKGLSLVDKALAIPLTEPSKPDWSWEKATVMVQKLRKTRKEIVIRIENVNSEPQPSSGELPPSYEEVVASSKSDSNGTDTNGNNFQVPGSSKLDEPYVPPSAICDEELLVNLQVNNAGNSESQITYSDLSLQLKEMKLAKDEEILFRCDNVHMFFIAPDGRTSTTSEPNTLIIARFHDNTSKILDEALLNIVSDLKSEMAGRKKKKHKHHSLLRKHHRRKRHGHGRRDESLDKSKRTFLQVASWVYPLISDVSPCIRSEIGAFLFPDTNADLEGAAVALILPEEFQEHFHQVLTDLLNDVASEGRSRRSVATDFAGDGYSSKIMRGASYIAYSLVRGAGSTARFLDTSTPKIIDRITPKAEPQPINPAVQKTVEVAKTLSGKAVNVTDYLATKICMATSALGRYLSPYIEKQGTRLLATTTSMSEEEAAKKLDSMLNVTSDAVQGISTVYHGLDTAASILARSLANNTVQIIEYKYGQPAGALTNDALTTFGNVYYTQHNFRVLKPKGIIKAAVRGAGQAILEDHRKAAASSTPHEEFRGSGPGDGSGFSAA